MDFSREGIGWLIAGIIVSLSAFGAGSIPDAIGSILFGLVFVAVYFLKQVMTELLGIVWFIGGGILTAFCGETVLGILIDAAKTRTFTSSAVSDVTVALIAAGICFAVFYWKNKGDM